MRYYGVIETNSSAMTCTLVASNEQKIGYIPYGNPSASGEYVRGCSFESNDTMDFLEKDLEDVIFEAAQTKKGRDFLKRRGLPLRESGKICRQVNLGVYGIADLIDVSIESVINNNNRHRYLDVEIIELKKDSIDSKALEQSCRYLTAVKEITSSIIGFEKFDEYNLHISLIGSSLDTSSDFVYLYNEISETADIITYKYKVDGIHFEYIPHKWHKDHPNFKQDVVNNALHPSFSDLKQCITIYDCRGESFL